MKKLFFLTLIICTMISCEQNQDHNINPEYIATIVGFDHNCSTCILEFPDNYAQIKKEIGESPNNYYQTINLNMANYKIGQKVKVKIRLPESTELRPCKTQFPSYGYKNIFITEFENFSNIDLNDTIELKYKECLYTPEDEFYICLDSVINDSRCPQGVMCIWEGNAEVKLRFEKLNQNPIFFNLNTYLNFTRDTTIDKYKFSLIKVNPSPQIGVRFSPSLYKVQLIIN